MAERAPAGDNWVSEIKFDGYRLLAAVDSGQVRLLTRNGHDWAPRMPSVAAAIGQLPAKSAMLDGELVLLRPDGVSSFPGLQSALKSSLTQGVDTHSVLLERFPFSLGHIRKS